MKKQFSIFLSVIIVYSLWAMPPKKGIKRTLILSYGISARQGPRDTMEDALAVASLDFAPEHSGWFFGVYDGHGGKKVAQYAADNLHYFVLNSKGDVEKRLQEAFKETDKNIIKKSKKKKNKLTWAKQGTTALVSVFDKTGLYVAWVGDSRAILARGGRVIALTEDHIPSKQEESERIEKAGEKITGQITPRVRGLAVSRSIGDYNKRLKPKSKKPKLDEAIISTPEIKHYKLHRRDRFVILASDGVWSVITNDEAMGIVRLALKLTQEGAEQLTRDPAQDQDANTFEGGNDPVAQYAARHLRDAAYDKGVHDNISVIVIRFNWEKEDDIQKQKFRKNGKKLLITRLKQFSKLLFQTGLQSYTKDIDSLIERLEQGIYNFKLIETIHKKVREIAEIAFDKYADEFLKRDAPLAVLAQAINTILRGERRILRK